jgi:putative aldouronate transport system substrate-binding protein
MRKVNPVTSLLILGLTVLVLGACAPKGNSGTAASGAVSSGLPDYLNATGYPIVKSPIEVTMMIRLDTARGVEPVKNSVWKKLEEISGIKWNYTVVDTTSWAERLSLTWASNELPDLFYNGIGSADVFSYIRAGKLLDIGPYLDQYAPDFKALMDINADVRRAITLPGGKIGSFVSTNMEIAPGQGQCPPEYVGINTKWLNKLGLKMPTTADEFYQVALAFRDRDPNGNGQKDEIAMVPRNAGVGGLKFLDAWFGFMVDGNDTFLDGDTVKYAPFMEEYVASLKYYNKLYTEGLLDKEIFTQNNAQVIAKGSGTTELYGAVISSAEFTVVGEARANDFDIAPVFKAPNGKEIWFNRVYANPGVGVISAATKYPEALVRWCNMFYDSDYSKYVWMGLEGDAYEWNADGTWNWKLRSSTDTTTAIRAEKTLQAGSHGASMCPPEWFKLNDAVEAPVNRKRVWMAENFFGKLRVAMPQIYYETADMRTISTISTDLKSYENQCFAKFVTGEMNIDREYPAFVAQLKQMGAENMVSLIQKNYDASR